MFKSDIVFALEEKVVRIERLFNAPLQLVWEVWTNPLHIEKWWGPKGFTNPTVEFDFKVGGSYRIVMRSPDGVDYPVKGKFLEITPFQSFVISDLVDEHPEEWVKDVQKMAGVTGDRELLNSKLRVLFEEAEGKTKVTLFTEFANNQIRDGFANSGMKEGWSESFEKLETNALPNPNQISLEKKLNHPQELVFNAFANPLTIDTWWGPSGFKTTTQTMDFRVGGKWIFTMLGPDGTIWPNTIKYKEIRKFDYLEYLHGSGEENKNDDFLVNVYLIAIDKNQTIVKMQMTFPDTNVRNAVIGFGAIESGQQTLSKLDLFLSKNHDSV
ncbi:SRPBCC domain-containing protein [Leptospira sp. WS4.C2]